MAIPNSNTRRNAVDLTGRKFGRWIVIRYHDKIVYRYATGGCTVLRWLCRCECGAEKIVRGNTLVNGASVSCRCYQIEFQRAFQMVHGHTASVCGSNRQTPEYAAWSHMMQRCFNTDCPEYKNYGERGITVCKRWRIAENFLADMGLKPASKHSLDRINNEGNYEPSNCRWATAKEQCRNTRRNHWIEWKGQKKLVTEWSRELSGKKNSLSARLSRGWSLERAMTTPFNTHVQVQSSPQTVQ